MSILKERNSNHELMRVISMFFIVFWHVVVYTRIQGVTNQSALFLYNSILFILVVHVNSYILLTGYYQSKSKFNQKKIWQIINSSWFYRIVIFALFLIFKLAQVTKVQFLKDIGPLPLDDYWFIQNYLLLYCISPFLNKLISCLDKKTFKKMLIVGFIIFSIIPCATASEFLDNSGFTLYHFVYLYFIGAYLREYPLDKSYHFKIFSKKAFQIIMIVVFILCSVLNHIIYYYGLEVAKINGILSTMFEYINYCYLNYNNPLIIIQSIAYFYLFTTLDLKSKFLNNLSKLMLGVYFIHENKYLRGTIYSWFRLNSPSRNSMKFIPYMFGVAIIIFVLCTIIEKIRQVIFKLISKTPPAKKASNSYYNFLKKIYISKE